MPSFVQYSLTTSGSTLGHISTGQITNVSGILPLAANAYFTAPGPTIDRASTIAGTIAADAGGTLEVEQSADGTYWDVISSITVASGVGQGFSVAALMPNVRFVYANGAVAQTQFRLSARTISAGT